MMHQHPHVEPIPFGNKFIGPGHSVFLIAEIGINHEGDAGTCARMIEEASRAGADAVKLQTVEADENYAPGTASNAIFRKAELSRKETADLFQYASKLGIEIFTTCGDPDSLAFVETLNPPGYKISSGLITHLPLIRKAACTGRPVLISTGMADETTIQRALEDAREAGAASLALFQCTSIYPAPPHTLNLASISFLEDKYGVPAGFSDHSEGTFAGALAVAAGARMIEKHFTLDPSRPGFDHGISLNPEGFKLMAERVRLAERMMGEYGKSPTRAEREQAPVFYRKLVARRDMSKGTVIKEGDVGFMRIKPNSRALSPSDLHRVVGRRLKSDLSRYAPITEEALR